jgi:hypothetical protein
MTDTQIKEAFEKWWMSTFAGLSTDETIRYRDVGKQSAFLGFQSAIKLLLPIIEKQRECLEYYANRIGSGGTARSTLKECDELMNKIRGEG